MIILQNFRPILLIQTLRMPDNLPHIHNIKRLKVRIQSMDEISKFSGTPFGSRCEGYPQEHQVCPLSKNFDPTGPVQLHRHMLNVACNRVLIETHAECSRGSA